MEIFKIKKTTWSFVESKKKTIENKNKNKKIQTQKQNKTIENKTKTKNKWIKWIKKMFRKVPKEKV